MAILSLWGISQRHSVAMAYKHQIISVLSAPSSSSIFRHPRYRYELCTLSPRCLSSLAFTNPANQRLTCPIIQHRRHGHGAMYVSTNLYTSETESNKSSSNDKIPRDDEDAQDMTKFRPPWSMPPKRTSNSSAYSRFRQHVNPLARRFQMSAELPDNWPKCDFDNVNLPLFLDIGCGKGGFLLDLVASRHKADQDGVNANSSPATDVPTSKNDANDQIGANPSSKILLPPNMNYLGLEIRPGVSHFAQARVEKRGLTGKLSFVGCNANVDLDRLLTMYLEAGKDTINDSSDDTYNNHLEVVSVQFPDPHFKKHHAKRRVVTPAIVSTLAKFMKEGGIVFLQSDIKNALEDMRDRFCEGGGSAYFFEDSETDISGENEQQEYTMENPLGVPTEREISVLKKDLPVYRTLFRRNGVNFNSG